MVASLPYEASLVTATWSLAIGSDPSVRMNSEECRGDERMDTNADTGRATRFTRGLGEQERDAARATAGARRGPSLTDEEVAELKRRAARIFNDGHSAYAAGDGAFLAALASVDEYKATSTASSVAMIEREFDTRTSLIVDPANGRIPPLTPDAQRRRAAAAAAAQLPPAAAEELSNDKAASWDQRTTGR